MKANSTNLIDLTVTDSLRRSWLLRFWIVGCLLATSFCVFKGLEASSSTRPTTRQTAVTKEVRKQTRMDEIKEGDVVLARDEFGDTVAPKKVTRVFRRTSDHLRLLAFESRDGTRQTIKTTDEHPFALADSLDFVAAGELAIGTEVPGPKGERQTLVASIREEHPEGIPVFNFEVEGFHTYFVCAHSRSLSLLVHNRCDLDDVAVIGRLPDTDVLHGTPGHRVLRIPDWDIDKNDAWIKGVIDEQIPVYKGSAETAENLFDMQYNRPRVFARELQQLRDAGFVDVDDYLLPPSFGSP